MAISHPWMPKRLYLVGLTSLAVTLAGGVVCAQSKPATSGPPGAQPGKMKGQPGKAGGGKVGDAQITPKLPDPKLPDPKLPDPKTEQPPGTDQPGKRQVLRPGLEQTLGDLRDLRNSIRQLTADRTGQATQRPGRIAQNLDRLQETLSGLENASPATQRAILSAARRILDSLVDDLDGLTDEADDRDLRRLVRLGRQLRGLDRSISALPLAGGQGSSGGSTDGTGALVGGTSDGGNIGGERVGPPATDSSTGEKKERPHTLVKDLLAKGLGTADALREDLRKLLAERPRLREFLEETEKELDQVRDDLARLRNAPLNNIAEVTEKTRLTASRLKDKVDKLVEGADAEATKTLNRLSTGLARLESELDALSQATMAKAK